MRGFRKILISFMPQFSCDTRWNSHNECSNSFISNYSKYCQVRLDHLSELDSRMSTLLSNMGLYSEAMNLSNQLNVLTTALNRLQ